MASSVSTTVLWTLASIAIAAAWISAARALWLGFRRSPTSTPAGWRLLVSALAFGLGAIASGVYRDLPTIEHPLVWEARLGQLGWLLLALAPPFLVAAIEAGRADPG